MIPNGENWGFWKVKFEIVKVKIKLIWVTVSLAETKLCNRSLTLTLIFSFKLIQDLKLRSRVYVNFLVSKNLLSKIFWDTINLLSKLIFGSYSNNIWDQIIGAAIFFAKKQFWAKNIARYIIDFDFLQTKTFGGSEKLFGSKKNLT